jgi:hypothetical protein
MATSVLPQALRSITTTKIAELSKQKAIFESRKAAVYARAAEQDDLIDRVRVLLEGVTSIKGVPDDGLDKSDRDDESEAYPFAWTRNPLRNIRRYLLQSKYDSSITNARLAAWERQLHHELDVLSVKHDHAIFFSQLVTEWLSNSASSTDRNKKPAPDGESRPVGREEMHQQRATWESFVFQPGNTDPEAIEAYLAGLFGKTTLSQQGLKDLQKRIRKFGKTLMADQNPFDQHTVKWVIQGVIQSDLLPPEKIASLREFLRSDAVTQEVADILNMRLSQLDTWTWATDAIPVEMRRHLNGKYRVYMDEDILDTLFLHFIGVKWAVEFKECFHKLFTSHAWKPSSRPIAKQDLERRRYFLEENLSDRASYYRPGASVDKSRRHGFGEYFMVQLPSSEGEVSQYDESGSETGYDDKKNFLNLKHSLLHLLIAESRLHQALYGGMTVVRSDFEWFGPSLPHETLLTILKFFGMSDIWLGFFQRFLKAPLVFAHDGPDAEVRTRTRGVPSHHSISDLLGEVMLFCMDYSVNQQADGMVLYRLHDDFWFWGPEERCARAWKAMSEFSDLMGIKFNKQKTGTARLGKRGAGPNDGGMEVVSGAILPPGDIRWGFLKLDEVSGRFLIDQAQVDEHIKELKVQLAACNSVFSWIKAWNGYFARFFTNNFGEPAMCFGRQHIEMVISTLHRIEKELFGNTEGEMAGSSNVTDYLRSIIANRFGVHDLPDGLFYFPVELGGLELRNPFIPFLNMREGIKTTPERILEKAFIADEKDYRDAELKFKRSGSKYILPASFESSPGGNDDQRPAEFMSLEEFTRYRESTSPHLAKAYENLLSKPEDASVHRTAELSNLVKTSGGQLPSSFPDTPYWSWVAELYFEDMVEKYGGLSAVESGSVPLGVVKVLKEGKIRWQG